MAGTETGRRPGRSRWTSFVAPPGDGRVRSLHEEGKPAHRLRVEHNAHTLLVHLSDEDGAGWTVLAVDRATRDWAVAQGRVQLDTAEQAVHALYDEIGGGNSGDGRSGRSAGDPT